MQEMLFKFILNLFYVNAKIRRHEESILKYVSDAKEIF